jgi:hypothetical protein
MKKVSVDVSGHANVASDAEVAAIVAAYEQLKTACANAGVVPLRAELAIATVGE